MASISFGKLSAQKIRTDPLTTFITADSLVSGNFKDVLTSFYQLAFNNLTGPKKELNFNSNPYALLLKSNPRLALDDNYRRYRHLRNLNFGIGIKMDSTYHFNGFSSGIKYNIINHRDPTMSKLLFQNLRTDSLGREADTLEVLLVAYINEIEDHVARDAFRDAMHAFFNGNVSFKGLDPSFRSEVQNLATTYHMVHILNLVNADPSSNLKSKEHHIFDSLKNLIKSEPLFTIGFSDTSYKDQFIFSNLLFSTEFLKGVAAQKAGSNLEIDLKASINFVDDTLSKGRDLKRSVFCFEPGINWVIRNQSNDQSYLEFKFSGSYNHNFAALYAKEKRDSITLNATLRIRLIGDIWLPLEIKYDPRRGNVFGFINVRVNFTGLRKFPGSQ